MLEEYEQHFAFKLADGYSEEEIAARLGSPAELAAQFEAAPQPKRRGSVALTAVCLIGRLDRFPPVTLPPMPYVSALLLGLALAALTVACCIGCVWFFAFVCQLFRAYGRFHRNTLAAAKGEPALPPLAVHPQFLPARRRRMRTALIVSFVCFGVCLALGMAVSAKLAGRLDFWNDWSWFYIHNCWTYDIPIQ